MIKIETDALDYCALTLATVLVWHPLRVPSGGGQWSPEMISMEMKALQYGSMGNFVVNPFALHQSFHIFKKSIRLFGHDLIPMGGIRGVAMIAEFMDLPEVSNGWNIKFVESAREYSDLNVILGMIGEKAKHLIKRLDRRELTFFSLTELGAAIFQRQLPVKRPAVLALQEPGSVKTNKRRKTSDELGQKQLSNCGKDIIGMIKRTTCVNDEDATPYLIAALTQSRSDAALDSISRSIFGSSSINDNDSVLLAIRHNPLVMASINLLPKRNIIFTDEEKDHVLRICDVIDVVMKKLPDSEKVRFSYTTCEVTKKVLERQPIYSELVEDGIERWIENRNKVRKKPGRKIDSQFEKAVWGKLMICEFERIEVILLSKWFLMLYAY